MPTILPSPQILEIIGADAVAFAHAQFCNDVIALPAGHWQWNAWLSPQGRVRYFFVLLRDAEDRVRLLLRGGDAEAMRVALTRFVFRAKLSLRAQADMQVLGCDEAETLARLTSLPTGDALSHHANSVGLMLSGPVRRWLLLQASIADTISSMETLNQWRLDDIRAGLPEVVPPLEDQLLPQWLGLDRLQAISVRKGCYPGQEIMARLHFKGGNKRGLYHLQLRCDALPAPGTPVFSGSPASVDVGVFANLAWSAAGCAEALAVLSDTAAKQALRTEPMCATEIKVISGFA